MTCHRNMVCTSIYSRTTCSSSGIPADIPEIVTVDEEWECIYDVSSWCADMRLQLSATKKEIPWFGSAANLSKISPGSRVISVEQNVIEPVMVVRDLGVLFDEDLSVLQHVAQLSQTCYFHLRRLDLCIDNSGVMLLQDLCARWCYRDGITVTPSLQDFQQQHWRHCSESCSRRPTCPELTSARPRDARCPETALVDSPAEDGV